MKGFNKVLLFTLFCTIVFSFDVFADEWVKDGNYSMYKVGDDYAKSTWKFIQYGDDYYNYYFDEKGHMVTGIWKIENDYYSFNEDGSPNSKGKVVIDEREFLTGNKGVIIDYPKEYEQDTFAGEWVADGNDWKYVVNGAPIVKDFRLIKLGRNDYHYYYFDENGHMVKDHIVKVDGNYYIFDKSGVAMSYTKVKLYDTECETEAKGKIVYLPSGFVLEDYYSDLAKESEAKKESESKALVEAENEKKLNALLSESIKAEEEKKAVENAARAKELQAKANAEAADRAAKVLNLSGRNYDKIVIDSDEGGSTTITYPVPQFSGTTASAVNQAVKNKLKEVLTITFEDRVQETSKKVSKKITDVSMSQSIDNHLITLSFSGDYYVKVYIDTNSLEIWSD